MLEGKSMSDHVRGKPVLPDVYAKFEQVELVGVLVQVYIDIGTPAEVFKVLNQEIEKHMEANQNELSGQFVCCNFGYVPHWKTCGNQNCNLHGKAEPPPSMHSSRPTAA